jgi:transcriptional regulator with XRE-family HTH domain
VMEVGKRIREIREDYGMSRNELARRVEVASNHLYMIETDHRTPSLGLIERIAHELRTEPAELLRGPATPKASAPPETGPDTAGEIIVYLSGEGSEPARNTAGELLSYLLAEGKLTVEDLEEASDALLREASESRQEEKEPVTNGE